MKEITLTVEKREGTGKEATHKYRRDGNIPGVIYGPETEPLTVAVKSTDLSNLIRHEGRTNMLIDLNVEGEKSPRKVIIRELQRDPITGSPFHIDLYQVSLKRKLHTTVMVNLNGTPDGVKNAGGILQQVKRELDIACLPDDIPNSIEIDVSELKIGDSIHVRDISLDKVEIIAESRLTIATVVPPTVIKVAEEVAEVAEGEEAAEEAAEGEAKPEEGKAEEGKAEKGKEEKSADKKK